MIMRILEEGVEWGRREDAEFGVITGDSANIAPEALVRCYGYSATEVALIVELRKFWQPEPAATSQAQN